MISCILLAAGSGQRMKLNRNKVFFRLGAYSVLQWDLLHLKEVPGLNEVIIVAAHGEEADIAEEVNGLELPWEVKITPGGEQRQDSVRCGTALVHEDSAVILVHDGARPLASPDLFADAAEAALQYGAAVVAVPSKDTVKRVGPDSLVIDTPDRRELYCVQTPQAFRREVLLAAQTAADQSGFIGTDDVSLVEHAGGTVKVIDGDYSNIKLTTPEDILLAKSLLGVKEPVMRVGFGYDVHRFKKGRPCVLGGVLIDSPAGPDGHSDADVLLHALMDALLGAAGLRDIGYYFPPDDDAYEGISSLTLLGKVNLLLKEKGLQAYNIDVMVIAEIPKINPHADQMKKNISAVLSLPAERISIKATTNEGLGAIGRREGIAAQAVVTLYEGEVTE